MAFVSSPAASPSRPSLIRGCIAFLEEARFLSGVPYGAILIANAFLHYVIHVDQAGAQRGIQVAQSKMDEFGKKLTQMKAEVINAGKTVTELQAKQAAPEALAVATRSLIAVSTEWRSQEGSLHTQFMQAEQELKAAKAAYAAAVDAGIAPLLTALSATDAVEGTTPQAIQRVLASMQGSFSKAAASFVETVSAMIGTPAATKGLLQRLIPAEEFSALPKPLTFENLKQAVYPEGNPLVSRFLHHYPSLSALIPAESPLRQANLSLFGHKDLVTNKALFDYPFVVALLAGTDPVCKIADFTPTFIESLTTALRKNEEDARKKKKIAPVNEVGFANLITQAKAKGVPAGFIHALIEDTCRPSSDTKQRNFEEVVSILDCCLSLAGTPELAKFAHYIQDKHLFLMEDPLIKDFLIRAGAYRSASADDSAEAAAFTQCAGMDLTSLKAICLDHKVERGELDEAGKIRVLAALREIYIQTCHAEPPSIEEMHFIFELLKHPKALAPMARSEFDRVRALTFAAVFTCLTQPGQRVKIVTATRETGQENDTRFKPFWRCFGIPSDYLDYGKKHTEQSARVTYGSMDEHIWQTCSAEREGGKVRDVSQTSLFMASGVEDAFYQEFDHPPLEDTTHHSIVIREIFKYGNPRRCSIQSLTKLPTPDDIENLPYEFAYIMVGESLYYASRSEGTCVPVKPPEPIVTGIERLALELEESGQETKRLRMSGRAPISVEEAMLLAAPGGAEESKNEEAPPAPGRTEPSTPPTFRALLEDLKGYGNGTLLKRAELEAITEATGHRHVPAEELSVEGLRDFLAHSPALAQAATRGGAGAAADDRTFSDPWTASEDSFASLARHLDRVELAYWIRVLQQMAGKKLGIDYKITFNQHGHLYPALLKDGVILHDRIWLWGIGHLLMLSHGKEISHISQYEATLSYGEYLKRFSHIVAVDTKPGDGPIVDHLTRRYGIQSLQGVAIAPLPKDEDYIVMNLSPTLRQWAQYQAYSRVYEELLTTAGPAAGFLAHFLLPPDIVHARNPQAEISRKIAEFEAEVMKQVAILADTSRTTPAFLIFPAEESRTLFVDFLDKKGLGALAEKMALVSLKTETEYHHLRTSKERTECIKNEGVSCAVAEFAGKGAITAIVCSDFTRIHGIHHLLHPALFRAIFVASLEEGAAIHDYDQHHYLAKHREACPAFYALDCLSATTCEFLSALCSTGSEWAPERRRLSVLSAVRHQNMLKTTVPYAMTFVYERMCSVLTKKLGRAMTCDDSLCAIAFEKGRIDLLPYLYLIEQGGLACAKLRDTACLDEIIVDRGLKYFEQFRELSMQIEAIGNVYTLLVEAVRHDASLSTWEEKRAALQTACQKHFAGAQKLGRLEFERLASAVQSSPALSSWQLKSEFMQRVCEHYDRRDNTHYENCLRALPTASLDALRALVLPAAVALGAHQPVVGAMYSVTGAATPHSDSENNSVQ